MIPIARLARDRAVAVYLLVAVLAAGGVFEYLRLPASIFPAVTFPLVKAIADVGEEPAAQMIPTVTRPLEEALLRVPGVRLVRSRTSRGSVAITAQFAWGTDMQAALQRAQAETQRVRPSLPPATKLDVEWMNTATLPILGYALTSPTRSQADLWDLAEYTLKPALIRIPGVSRVQIQGGSRREFEVRLDRDALDGRQLAATDVIAALRRDNRVLSAGLVERNHELYLTLVDGRVDGIDALARVAVPLPGGGPPARLGELGTIAVADEVSYVRTAAGGSEAVLVSLLRQPSANTIAIADGVRALLERQPPLVPQDVRWTTFYDQARFVADSAAGVRDAIAIGVGLAALVMLVFLRRLRLTVVAVVAIPVTVAIVVLGIAALGQTVNLMTLAGVAAAIGLIADDAIVVVENIHRHREQAISGEPAESGLAEIAPALVGSSLSTIVIFIPFALLAGVVGAFFKPLALTMALTLVVSFLVALVVVPVSVGPAERPRAVRSRDACAWWRRRTATPRRRLAGFSRRVDGGWDRAVRFALRHGSFGVLGATLLLGCAWLLHRGIGTDFLPRMDEGTIILDYWSPPGTSLTDTDEMLRHAEAVIMATPGVVTYSRRTGTQLGFHITEPNRGDTVIRLGPRADRAPVGAIISELRRRVAAVEPALHTDFGQLLEDNIGDLTGGTPQPIDVKILGDDPAVLAVKAKQAARIVAGVTGVEDVFDGITIAGPAIDVRVDPTAAARFGLTTEDLQARLEPAVAGTVAGEVRVGDRVYDLRVFDRRAESPGEVTLRTPTGALVPVSSVASVTIGMPENEIDRENLRTFLGVTARLSGRDLGSAMAEVQRGLREGLPLPQGMSIEYGGAYQQQQSSFRQLFHVLLAGLVLVGVVVLFEFGDWRAPLLVALIALGALAGVLLLLRLTGTTLDISSYVGAIMMVGIVGENAIFVIHEARLELRRGTAPGEAWRLAARRRLRPVAMTILATVLALGPLALAWGQGAQLMQPLAIAVIGGFLVSGPAVLLLLPSCYALLDPRGRLGGRGAK